ncbi:MAG: hypothetical protein WCW68_14380, partial [Methanothrix sp.]
MIDPKVQRCASALAFNNVIYPFTYPEIVDSFKAKGYAVAVPPGALPSGGRVYLGGPIATKAKESITVIAKEESKVLMVEGLSINKVIASTEEIIKIVKEDFLLDMGKDLS